jgi:proteasome assembly chaperone (PAC2) family protein
MLGIKVDMNDLDKEIEKSRQIVAKMREIEQRREEYARRIRKSEEERITYIS